MPDDQRRYGSADDIRRGAVPDDLPAWAQRCLTRVDELDALTRWSCSVEDRFPYGTAESRDGLRQEIFKHLACARDAAQRRGRWPSRLYYSGARIDMAMSRLDSAEAELLQVAPADYLLGQMPSILNHVGRHLQPTDNRRIEVERIANQLTAAQGDVAVDTSRSVGSGGPSPDLARRAAILNEARGVIVSAVRGASSAALREQMRVRSFRNVVVAATIGMLMVATGLVILGAVSPNAIPLCFAPEEADEITIVCPTEQSGPISAVVPSRVTPSEINTKIDETVSSIDMAVVAIIGTTAAAVAAAAAIRRIRGSSEPYGVPIALAILKLPTGAVTAILGLVLMRGGFVPGLSALDTPAQIVAWAAIFGYAQQLFTRLVDQQASAVLDTVRGADKSTEATKSS